MVSLVFRCVYIYIHTYRSISLLMENDMEKVAEHTLEAGFV